MGNSTDPVRCLRTLVDVEGARVAEFEIAPGAQGARHFHSSVSEHCICLKGQVDVNAGGSSLHSLQPGDGAEIGPGVAHQVSNPGSEPGRYLVVQHGGVYDFLEV